MVSDQDIAKGVETLLRQSDPNSLTSLNVVVQQLEAKLGLDLSDKAGFIRDQINLLLRAHPTSATTTQQQPPPRSQADQVFNVTHKDQFASHHAPPFPPQFQQFSSHFALQQHHSQDINFRQPQAGPSPQLQAVQPLQIPQLPLSASQNNVAVVAHDQSPKESSCSTTSAGSKRRGGPGGLNKVCGVSPELEAVVGEPALPRTEIVKKLWAYIRKNNLQDPSNKRKIICDDALRVLFETDCTDMFKMNKLLAKHIHPLKQTKETGQAKRAKVEVESTTEITSESASCTAIISEPLAKFFGTDEKEMLDTEVMRRVWEYIKLNRLEDPVNPMAIHCDEKLRELLGCQSISAVGINEMLRRHIFKRS